jgi:DNA-binding transcriptional ArsR family regulator
MSGSDPTGSDPTGSDHPGAVTAAPSRPDSVRSVDLCDTMWHACGHCARHRTSARDAKTRGDSGTPMSRPLAGPQGLLRTLNGRAILEALARSGPQTRSELMSTTGLSRTAVTQVLRMLENAGAVAPAGVDRDTRGPAAGRFALHPRLGFAVAVHVDHHAAHVVLVDATGVVRAAEHAPFVEAENRVAHIVALIEKCRRSVKAAKGAVHLAVVGVPGIVTADGGIRDDLGPDGGAFRAALSAALDCPVRIENDVNLAALAELTSGEGGALSSFALLLLDDGLGAGIVIDGALHRGFSGVAGEVMYLPQTPIPIGAPLVGDAVVGDLALGVGRDAEASGTRRRSRSSPNSPAASCSWRAAWDWCSTRRRSSSAVKRLILPSSPRSSVSPVNMRRSSRCGSSSPLSGLRLRSSEPSMKPQLRSEANSSPASSRPPRRVAAEPIPLSTLHPTHPLEQDPSKDPLEQDPSKDPR